MNNKLLKILYTFIFGTLCFVSIFVWQKAQAQQNILPDDITYTQTPQNPRQGEKVKLELKSYVIDVNRSEYSWKIKDKEILAGVGEKTITLNTNDYVLPLVVKVTIKTDTGETVTKSISIDLSNVDVLWEATDSYVPPFYKGKALPSSESKIRVTAFVQNNASSIESPEKFITKWTRNGNIEGKGESINNIFFEYKNSYLNTGDDIGLNISGTSNSFSAKKLLSIPVYDPILSFYEQKGIEGIQYQKELSNGFKMTNKESTIVATPYFFSPLNVSNGELTFDWFINNTKIKTPIIKNILGLELSDNKNGKAEISLEIKSLTKILLSGEGKIPVQIQIQ